MIKLTETKIYFISILISLLVFNIFDQIFLNNFKNQFFFFLLPLLWPGVAHGSLDLILAKRIGIISNLFSSIFFIIIYLSLSLLIAYVWLKLPEISLLIFLLISVLHFGMSDCLLETNNKIYSLEVILRGFIPIVMPIFLYEEIVGEIFELLLINPLFFDSLGMIFEGLYYFILCLFVIFSLVLINQNERYITHILSELLAIIFCFYYFEPLIAFSIYFCFLHSLRHLMDEQKENKFTIIELLKKTIPITSIVLFLGLYIMFFVNIGVSNYKYIAILFISLAALTVPHMILVCISKRKSI